MDRRDSATDWVRLYGGSAARKSPMRRVSRAAVTCGSCGSKEEFPDLVQVC